MCLYSVMKHKRSQQEGDSCVNNCNFCHFVEPITIIYTCYTSTYMYKVQSPSNPSYTVVVRCTAYAKVG